MFPKLIGTEKEDKGSKGTVNEQNGA